MLLAPSSPVPVSNKSSSLLRIAPVLALFVIEAIALTTWRSVNSLVEKPGLAGVIGHGVVLILRSGVAFATAYAGVTGMRSAAALQQCIRDRIDWRMLTAHAITAVLFAVGSRAFFHGRPDDVLVALWIATGVSSFWFGLSAVTEIPQLVRALRPSLANVAAGVLAASATAAFGWFNSVVWREVSGVTLRLVAAQLALVLPNVTTGPGWDEIGTDVFRVNVGIPCSGIEGVLLMLAFGSIWLACFRSDWKFPNALALLPLSAGLAWLLNSVRIAVLILIGHYGAPGVATGGFHSQAGWIGFSLIALLVFGGARRFTWFRQDSACVRPGEASGLKANPAAPFILPFLAIMAASMISKAASAGGFEPLYPLRFIAAAGCLLWFRKCYTSVDWRFGPVSVLAGAAVFGIWMGVARYGGSSSDIPAGLASLPSWQATLWLAVRAAASITTVPIAEELAFRGFLMRVLVNRNFFDVPPRAFTFTAVAVSSAAFGAMHGGQWIGGTIAGLVYAFTSIRCGRLGEAVAAHAVTNALIAAWVLWTGEWSLW